MAWTMENLGRRFYGYARYKNNECCLFVRVDLKICDRGNEVILELLEKNREMEKQVHDLHRVLEAATKNPKTIVMKKCCVVVVLCVALVIFFFVMCVLL